MIFCSAWFTTVLVTTVSMQLILQFLCQLSKPSTVMNASIEKEESSHSASKLVQTCFNVSSDKWRVIIKLHCMQSSWSFKQDRPPQTRVKLIIIKRPSMQQFSLIVYHQQIVGDNNCNLMVLLYILFAKWPKRWLISLPSHQCIPNVIPPNHFDKWYWEMQFETYLTEIWPKKGLSSL